MHGDNFRFIGKIRNGFKSYRTPHVVQGIIKLKINLNFGSIV